jgi:ABC-type transport system substrate-binding protein
MINYLKGLLKLPSILHRNERMGVIGLLLVALISAGVWWFSTTANWNSKPVKGGVYSEGIIAAAPQDIDNITAKLTRIGLTYVDHKGETKGALADRWEITDEGKKYTFYLRPGVDAKQVADIYSSLPTWQNIVIAATDGSTLTMTLKQPFSLLLSFTSDPVVDAGPYKVEKETKTDIIYTANEKFILGEPNLQRIIITFYTEEKLLKAALQRQEVNAADIAARGVAGTSIKKLTLTKQTALLFNIDKPLFKDKAIREKIKNNQKLDKPTDATLVTTQEPEHLELANDFAKRAQKLNLNVSIKSVNQIVLDRDIVPQDQYDLILTTLNYGYDQDPYPYWHSSQVIGNGKNYAGYINKEADKLIEQARQTVDLTERENKYKQFKNILEQDVPGIFYPNQVFEYTVSKRIKGITEGIGAVPTDRYTGIWTWYLKAKKVKES